MFRRIHPNDTAETLNAEDGDVINVYSEQAGGIIPHLVKKDETIISLEQEEGNIHSLQK